MKNIKLPAETKNRPLSLSKKKVSEIDTKINNARQEFFDYIDGIEKKAINATIENAIFR